MDMSTLSIPMPMTAPYGTAASPAQSDISTERPRDASERGFRRPRGPMLRRLWQKQ